jgi:molecular chaperone DnaK
MREDAKAHAEEDRRRKEEVDIKNSADALIFSTERQLRDLGDKLSAEDSRKINDALNALREAHKSGSVASIKPAMETLSKVWQEVSTRLYQQDGATRSANSDTSKKEGEVKNADFEVVDDK